MPETIFLHAPNVHQGGGKSLLMGMLGALAGNQRVVAQMDSRMASSVKEIEGVRVRFVEPSVRKRLYAEWFLRQRVSSRDAVLCFGNLPPLFKLKGQVAVFVQNRYLIDRIPLTDFGLKTSLRIRLERLWLLRGIENTDEFVVQTPSMKALMTSFTAHSTPVHVRPFVEVKNGYSRGLQNNGDHQSGVCRFVYVASGEPHKNHRRLVEAWCLLASEGMFPSLSLTLDGKSFPELCRWIEKKTARFRLNIENLGVVPRHEMNRLYGQAQALIFPSTLESFGLPLIEANQAGLPVLAPELDFIRDVLDPVQSFDPRSPRSIARAVKRFMGVQEAPLPLMGADEFVKSLFEG